MKILINHLGYGKYGYKKAIVQTTEEFQVKEFVIKDAGSDRTVFSGQAGKAERVYDWRNWFFSRLEFTEFSGYGEFYILISVGRVVVRSEEFEIRDNPYLTNTLTEVLSYFTSQRCEGIYDQADRHMSFFGAREERVDVHGGWYDASGDVSKYLSHLSYANYMNPQQIPLVVWSLLYSFKLVTQQKTVNWKYLPERIISEALFGADFLVRIQDKAGYFYMTVFDGWTMDINKREICSYSTIKGIKSEAYEASFRQGGGMAIAALAGMSGMRRSGEFDSQTYLEAAKKGFRHLEENNTRYLDDGKENIIDDYCALMAASELFLACGEEDFLRAAVFRAENLINRISRDQSFDGWWCADGQGERPFFHASDAGLPVMALLRFMDIEHPMVDRTAVLRAVRKSLEFELSITNEVSNPFGYARQYVKAVDESRKSAFFFPHQNESGYWWQGENARLASLCTVGSLASRYFKAEKEIVSALRKYAQDQLDWILGLNPFDRCMLHGKGRNNPEYTKFNLKNRPGGICNGITSGYDDEQDIEFLPSRYRGNLGQNWRWTEQWLPHAAWYFLAVCAGAE